MQKISFVIPCYGSEHSIEKVINEINKSMQQASLYEWEIVMVSDCSYDNVFSVIKQLAKSDRRLKALRFTKNYGQHAATLAGFKYASGDIIIAVDDDGQTPVDESHKLIEKINEGYDVVFAGYKQKKHNVFRNIASKINIFMMERLVGKPKGVPVNSFFAVKRIIANEMVKYDNPYPYLGGLIFRVTKNIGSVEVNHRERLQGKSGYKFSTLLKLWLNGFTAFSVKPLRLSSYIGAASAFIGFIYGIYIIIRKILTNTTPIGYSSLMASILFFSGMILMVLGIIGEYIGRIYICINKSPQYVIAETLNINKEDMNE